METFFRKTGNNKLRFKPAYNPYTEPSMEIFSYHEGLKKWIEVGNVSSCTVSLSIGSEEADLRFAAVRYVQARDAGANGSAKGSQGAWVGYVAGATDNDQVGHAIVKYSSALWLKNGSPADTASTISERSSDTR